jgi:hypothetical protein
VVTVRLSMEQLLLIEERYGSMGGFQDKLTAAVGEDRVRQPFNTMLVDAIACCMPTAELRERSALARMLAPERLYTEYVPAAVAALREAAGAGGDEKPQDGQGNAVTATAAGSPGPTSTTPAPSSSVAPTTPSGG